MLIIIIPRFFGRRLKRLIYQIHKTFDWWSIYIVLCVTKKTKTYLHYFFEFNYFKTLSMTINRFILICFVILKIENYFF